MNGCNAEPDFAIRVLPQAERIPLARDALALATTRLAELQDRQGAGRGKWFLRWRSWKKCPFFVQTLSDLGTARHFTSRK